MPRAFRHIETETVLILTSIPIASWVDSEVPVPVVARRK